MFSRSPELEGLHLFSKVEHTLLSSPSSFVAVETMTPGQASQLQVLNVRAFGPGLDARLRFRHLLIKYALKLAALPPQFQRPLS